MAKQTRNHVALADLEKRAQEFISLSFGYCEEELRLSTRPHPHPVLPRNTALAAATLSVQESIKTLLAVARINLNSLTKPGAHVKCERRFLLSLR